MLALERLQELAKRYQTLIRNVVREYVQHLFLQALYKIEGSQKLLFKGGTALRLIYQSPRFSEDLDFTGVKIYDPGEIDNLFLEALSDLEKLNIPASYDEAKPTTGGYLGIIRYELFEISEGMKFEVSLRRGRPVTEEAVTIVSDFTMPYTLVRFPPKESVSEKMQALLTRKKPRDYYDLYFMLRHPELRKWVPKDKLSVVLENLQTEKINFRRELSVLLPASHHLILRDFKKILRKEIEKYR